MRSMIRSGTPLAVVLAVEPVVEGLDWLVALVDPVVCAVEAFVAARLVSSIWSKEIATSFSPMPRNPPTPTMTAAA